MNLASVVLFTVGSSCIAQATEESPLKRESYKVVDSVAMWISQAAIPDEDVVQLAVSLRHMSEKGTFRTGQSKIRVTCQFYGREGEVILVDRRSYMDLTDRFQLGRESQNDDVIEFAFPRTAVELMLELPTGQKTGKIAIRRNGKEKERQK